MPSFRKTLLERGVQKSGGDLGDLPGVEPEKSLRRRLVEESEGGETGTSKDSNERPSKEWELMRQAQEKKVKDLTEQYGGKMAEIVSTMIAENQYTPWEDYVGRVQKEIPELRGSLTPSASGYDHVSESLRGFLNNLVLEAQRKQRIEQVRKEIDI